MKKIVSILLFYLLACGGQDDAAQALNKTFTNSIGMVFAFIPAGKFTHYQANGNSSGEDARPHKAVTISRPFYLGKYEVTQEQWEAVMGPGNNPSSFSGRTNPVERVSWNEAQEFIKKLNQKEGGEKYRLPTEAEWEHAARAGSDTEWFFGNSASDLDKYAWYVKNSERTTHPVGQKKPNRWGLYDMYGNAYEWVQDWYGEGWNEDGAVTDPTGPASGAHRVFRGGGWNYLAENCRSSSRYSTAPGHNGLGLGFRLAISPEKLREAGKEEEAPDEEPLS